MDSTDFFYCFSYSGFLAKMAENLTRHRPKNMVYKLIIIYLTEENLLDFSTFQFGGKYFFFFRGNMQISSMNT